MPIIMFGSRRQVSYLFNNKEIYHPDLNTNNILIDDELNVYLIDFDTSSRLHQKISSKRTT